MADLVTVLGSLQKLLTLLLFSARDWRFSKTLKGYPVPFGEAGDCYSSAGCPQGRFAINLVGTAFRVAEVTRWNEYGDKSRISVHRHEVSVFFCLFLFLLFGFNDTVSV